MVWIMKSDLWQVDDPLFLLSAHPLQSNHPAASNPSSAPERCDTNPEVQSCLKLLSVFVLLLSHTLLFKLGLFYDNLKEDWLEEEH